MPTSDELALALQEALKTGTELRQENERLRPRAPEPVAIVGGARRLPGGVASAGELWRLSVDERDAVGGFPADRSWDVPGIHDTVHDSLEVPLDHFADPKFRPCALLREMTAAGWLGRKSGRGFYLYNRLGRATGVASTGVGAGERRP